MGQALLAGWLRSGFAPVTVLEKSPAEELTSPNVALNPPAPLEARGGQAVVLAVKPQDYRAVLDEHLDFIHADALVISILAGISTASLQSALPGRHIVRAMPNTPATVGRGITALCAAAEISDRHKCVALELMQAVGEAVWLEDEALMDAVTAVSGSGPAYLFHFAEALTAAAVEAGLPPDLAEIFARKTVSGAAALLENSDQAAAALRENVTSRGGTTEAALAVLTADPGLTSLLSEAVKAAKERSRELSRS